MYYVCVVDVAKMVDALTVKTSVNPTHSTPVDGAMKREETRER